MLYFRHVRFSGISGCRKEFSEGIEIWFCIEPDPVHEVKIRAERRERIGLAANQYGKKSVMGKPFYPQGEGKGSEFHGNHKDKRAQNLRLVFSRPASMGIKRQKKNHYFVSIEKAKLLPENPKFRV